MDPDEAEELVVFEGAGAGAIEARERIVRTGATSGAWTAAVSERIA